jgi:hypothetical protein
MTLIALIQMELTLKKVVSDFNAARGGVSDGSLTDNPISKVKCVSI